MSKMPTELNATGFNGVITDPETTRVVARCSRPLEALELARRWNLERGVQASQPEAEDRAYHQGWNEALEIVGVAVQQAKRRGDRGLEIAREQWEKRSGGLPPNSVGEL
jgi:hypothetical protein